MTWFLFLRLTVHSWCIMLHFFKIHLSLLDTLILYLGYREYGSILDLLIFLPNSGCILPFMLMIPLELLIVYENLQSHKCLRSSRVNFISIVSTIAILCYCLFKWPQGLVFFHPCCQRIQSNCRFLPDYQDKPSARPHQICDPWVTSWIPLEVWFRQGDLSQQCLQSAD